MRFPVLLLCFLILSPLRADDVIILGSGGSNEYRERFGEWGLRLKTVLLDKLNRPKDSVNLLTAETTETDAARTDLEKIREVFDGLARNHDPNKNLFIYLIGHGSHLRGESKFQIPGPDLSARELSRLLAPVKAKRVVLIQATSASAAFINELSGIDRIICTATKSVREENATEFMEFFIQSLEEGLADQNRDERISVWEATSQAAALTEAWYQENGLIATEHALLDDNGDMLGTRLHLAEATNKQEDLDGDQARDCFIKDFSFPASVPQALIDQYLGLVKQAEALKTKKAGMNEADYYNQLEKIMISAAQTHRKIRKASSKP